MSAEQSEFDRFVAALPKSWESQLTVGDAASTAFWQARRAGWELDVLTHDALSRQRRGGLVGVIVNRLNELAKHPPRATTKDHRRAPWEPPRFVPQPAVQLPPSWVVERRQLMRKIRQDGVTPEQAEQMMQDLIADQTSRLE